MPKVKVAAIVIAKDKRENAEKRKKKVKTEGDKFVNQNERLTAQKKQALDDPFELKPGMNELSDDDEDIAVTITSSLYDDLMEDSKFLLTM